eukprot:GAHX01000454.1.p1 GENE.GAHX01000454.1~~GAHX01000454.1.p1  ORF type:complete len:194 (-),score=28.29 GAHX01000454.1:34-570(-)
MPKLSTTSSLSDLSVKKDMMPYRLTFWYINYTDSCSTSEYKHSLQKLCSTDQLSVFWDYYSYIKRPNDLSVGSQLSLFKGDIEPMWETEENKHGGRFIFSIPKPFIDSVWQVLIFYLLGTKNELSDLINGIMITIDQRIYKVAVWISNNEEKKLVEQLGNIIRKITGSNYITFKQTNY